jgi:transcriptional regulator with XRE-family HTH domain
MIQAGDPSTLLRDARRRAGLSQRELAARAGTAQSVVARIEGGHADPSTGTLARLLAAAGCSLELRSHPAPVLDRQLLDDVPRILALAPEERLRELANVDRFVAAARRV